MGSGTKVVVAGMVLIAFAVLAIVLFATTDGFGHPFPWPRPIE